MKARAALANFLWLAASRPAHQRFVRALADPSGTQERWLRAHLACNGATSYGRAHGLREIRTYDDFARRIPIAGYDDLDPWIARIRKGETRVLTHEPVTRLLPTSGSTGARKLIPFTARLQSEFNAAIGPWLIDLGARHRGIAAGPAYWSVTPLDARNETQPSVVPIGFEDDSRYLGGARAWLVNSAMAVPSSVRHLRDLPTFRRTVLLHLLRRADLRFISVWHPSFLALLLDALVREWDWLRGELRREGHSREAARLHGVDPTDTRSLWPELRVVSCWADAHAAGPCAELARRLPHVTIQPKGLLATEAFVTLPFAGQHPLALGSHFFEFLDEEGRVHLVGSLRPGKAYEVIVTTGGGLWRYRLGDRVDVTGFVDRTPSLRFLGRTGNVSDRCGEKLSEAFVAQVLARLCPGASFALLAPEPVDDAWRYVLHFEGQEPPWLALRLDEALSENPHYALCRQLGQLTPPSVQRIEHGGYERFVAAETARGLRLGDIKPVALSTRPDWSRHFSEAAI